MAKSASMPSAPTLPPLTLQEFLDFPVFSFRFFPGVAPQKFVSTIPVVIWLTLGTLTPINFGGGARVELNQQKKKKHTVVL